MFIGPYDLSASMGKTGEVDAPDVVAAIDEVTRACQRHDVTLGFFGLDAASVAPWIERGYSLICAGVDAGFITAGAAAIAGELRK